MRRFDCPLFACQGTCPYCTMKPLGQAELGKTLYLVYADVNDPSLVRLERHGEHSVQVVPFPRKLIEDCCVGLIESNARAFANLLVRGK